MAPIKLEWSPIRIPALESNTRCPLTWKSVTRAILLSKMSIFEMVHISYLWSLEVPSGTRLKVGHYFHFRRWSWNFCLYQWPTWYSLMGIKLYCMLTFYFPCHKVVWINLTYSRFEALKKNLFSLVESSVFTDLSLINLNFMRHFRELCLSPWFVDAFLQWEL